MKMSFVITRCRSNFEDKRTQLDGFHCGRLLKWVSSCAHERTSFGVFQCRIKSGGLGSESRISTYWDFSSPCVVRWASKRKWRSKAEQRKRSTQVR
jgi:hypothetical protein